MKRKRPGWERPRPRLLAVRRLSSRGRGCPRPFHELALTDTGGSPPAGNPSYSCNRASPSEVYTFYPGTSGRTAARRLVRAGQWAGDRAGERRKEASNKLATCLQLASNHGAAMALLGSCERVPLAARLGRRRIGIYPCQRQPPCRANSVMGGGRPPKPRPPGGNEAAPAPTLVAS